MGAKGRCYRGRPAEDAGNPACR